MPAWTNQDFPLEVFYWFTKELNVNIQADRNCEGTSPPGLFLGYDGSLVYPDMECLHSTSWFWSSWGY